MLERKKGSKGTATLANLALKSLGGGTAIKNQDAALNTVDVAVDGFDIGLSSSDAHVALNRFSARNGNVGAQVRGGSLTSDGAVFDNVNKPFDVSGIEQADVQNSRSSNRQRKSTISGWTSSDRFAAPLPVFCSTCKRTSASRRYFFEGQYYNLWNNTETCPLDDCGAEGARLSEGTFKLLKGVAEIIAAPDFTFVMFQAIEKIVRDVAAGSLPLAEAEESLATVSPGIADIITHPWLGETKNQRLVTIMTALALMVGVFACVPDWYDMFQKMEQKPKADDITAASLLVNGNINIDYCNDSRRVNGDIQASRDYTDAEAVAKVHILQKDLDALRARAAVTSQPKKDSGGVE